MSRLRRQIVRLIDGSGLSRYEIAKRSGVGADTLCKFMSGERGLSFEALERLAECLGWSMTAGDRATAKRPGRKTKKGS